MRTVLVVAAWLCLVAGLVPSSRGGAGSSGWSLGLPFSPVYWYHRESFASADGITIGEGTRIEASSISGYRSEWHIRVFSWSMALVLAGAVLLFVSLRSRREPR